MAANAASDARLIEECNAFHKIFSRYVRGCAALSDLEAGGTDLAATEVQRWTSVHWQDALCRVSRIVAETPPGTLAKGGVLKNYLAERPVDDPYGTGLMFSILADLEHMFG